MDSDLSGQRSTSNVGTGSNVTSSNTTKGSHSSTLANQADPRVDSDLSGNRGTTSVGPASGVVGSSADGTSLPTDITPSGQTSGRDHHLGRDAGLAGAGAAGVGAYEAGKHHGASGTAGTASSTTSDPYSSRVLILVSTLLLGLAHLDLVGLLMPTMLLGQEFRTPLPQVKIITMAETLALLVLEASLRTKAKSTSEATNTIRVALLSHPPAQALRLVLFTIAAVALQIPVLVKPAPATPLTLKMVKQALAITTDVMLLSVLEVLVSRVLPTKLRSAMGSQRARLAELMILVSQVARLIPALTILESPLNHILDAMRPLLAESELVPVL